MTEAFVFHPQDRFTPNESNALVGIVNCLSSKETAKKKGIKRQTVQNYLTTAYKKIGATSRYDALSILLSSGFFSGLITEDSFDLSKITNLSRRQFKLYKTTTAFPEDTLSNIALRIVPPINGESATQRLNIIKEKLGINLREELVLFDHAITRTRDFHYTDGMYHNPTADKYPSKIEIEEHRHSPDPDPSSQIPVFQ